MPVPKQKNPIAKPVNAENTCFKTGLFGNDLVIVKGNVRNPCTQSVQTEEKKQRQSGRAPNLCTKANGYANRRQMIYFNWSTPSPIDAAVCTKPACSTAKARLRSTSRKHPRVWFKIGCAPATIPARSKDKDILVWHKGKKEESKDDP